MTLEAVQEAAQAHASTQAEAIVAAGRERAEQILAAARAEAGEVAAARHAQAERLADLEAGEQIADARARARAIVLAARRTALAEATAAARAAATKVIGDPRYESLIERQAADARERLRDAGPVHIIPVAGGGFVARAGTRQIDCSLDAQVGRCLEAMARELERLLT